MSEDRAVEEPADNQQARHDADTITKDVDTRHHKHPSNKGDLRRLDGKITSVLPCGNSKIATKPRGAATDRFLRPLNDHSNRRSRQISESPARDGAEKNQLLPAVRDRLPEIPRSNI